MNLNRHTENFLSKIVGHPKLERCWLLTLKKMEEIAALQIQNSIRPETPKEMAEEITHHAADEWRHAKMIGELIPLVSNLKVPSPIDKLEMEFESLGESFVNSYFGNSLLRKAKNRHCAYVHGALTIEQFPFQFYTVYKRLSKNPEVQRVLGSIIEDEYEHIQLGKRLRSQLSEEELLPLEKLNNIERKMAILLVKRLSRLTETHEQNFVDQIINNDRLFTAWMQSLSHAERAAADNMQQVYLRRQLPLPADMPEHVADEYRHSEMLAQSVLIGRAKYHRDDVFKKMERQLTEGASRYLKRLFLRIMKLEKDPDLIHNYGACLLETRVFRHYTDIVNTTKDIGLAFTVSSILEDEADHVRMVTKKLSQHPSFDKDLFKKLELFEHYLFERQQNTALTFLKEVDSCSHLHSLA